MNDGRDDKSMDLADLLRRVWPHTETVFDIANEADEDGVPRLRVTVGARELQPEPPEPPRRAESRPRAHTFHSAAGLAAYLRRYGGPETVVFADVPEQRMMAVLDETVDYGFEIVEMAPQVHPKLAPWLDLLDKGFIPIQEFALFVLENRRSLEATGEQSRELALVFSQVRAAVAVEVQAGFGAQAVNGVMVEHSVEGSRKKQPLELPDRIALDCPVYVGTPNQQISIDLTVTVLNHQVVIRPSAADLVEARVAAFEAMLSELRGEGEDTPWTLVLGRAQHADWRYLTT